MGRELDNIDLTVSQRKEITALLKRYLPDTEVWAYGSRVKFTAKPSSDLDLVAFASKEQSAAMANLREAFEESSLPFRVDLFIWDRVPKQFHKNIAEGRVVLQKKAEKKNLPEGWEDFSFTDVVDVNPPVKLKKGQKYPFVDMKSVEPTWREVSFSELRTFKGGGAKFLPQDTLMARITPCLENGKIARYMPSGRSGEAFGSTEFIVIRGKNGVTDNDFAYYLTMWSEFRDFAISQMTGSSGRQRVPVDSLAGFYFNLPPLPEQKAIAHILGSLDNKIELNRRMNKTLEAMAQALFTSWFVDFDPVIDNALAVGNEIPEELKKRAKIRKALGNTRKPLLEEIRNLFPSEFEYTEEMSWIPKGWRVSTVGEEFNVTMGQSPPGTTYNEMGQGVPFFQGRADFGFRYPSERIYCTAPKRFAEQNDTLVSVRAPIGDVNMAFEKCCIGRGVGAVRHKSSSRSYTYYSMLQLRQHFNAFEAEGTVFGSISQKDFKSLKWLKSNQVLIELYEKLTGQFDEKIELCFMNISELSTLRDTLLPKLLSGEIRIPDAEKLVEEEKVMREEP